MIAPLVNVPLKTQTHVSLEEYFALPEGRPNYEYEEGELVLMNPPHGRHQELMLALGGEIRQHAIKMKLGRIWPELEVHLPKQRRVYIPDLVFLTTKHLNRYSTEGGRMVGVPDLVVEILSPGTAQRDRTHKLRVYQRAGVTWYWIVEPSDLTIEEYRLTPEGYLLAQSVAAGEVFSPGVFPELKIDLAALVGETQ